MRRRMAAAILAVVLAAGCATGETPGFGESTGTGTQQPNGNGDGGNGDGGNGNGNGDGGSGDGGGNGQVTEPTDEVILAPIKVPDFGGDAEFAPNSPRRLEELIRERCEDGSLCVSLTYTVDPPGTDPYITAQYPDGGATVECRTTSIEPHGDAIPAGTEIAVGVDCTEVLALLSQNGGEQDDTTDDDTTDTTEVTEVTETTTTTESP